MMTTQAELEKLKLPDLKKRCKELKIAGYSKLSKADLIRRLLAGTGAPDSRAGQDTQSPPSTILPSSVYPPIPSQRPGDARTAEEKPQAKKRKTVVGPKSPAGSSRSSAPSHTIPVADQSQPRADLYSKPPSVVPLLPGPSFERSKISTTKSKATATVTPVPTGRSPVTPSKDKLPIATSPTSRRLPQAIRLPRARFIPPPRIIPPPLVPQVPSNAATQCNAPIKLDTLATRTAYMKTHFLNDIFEQIIASRTSSQPSDNRPELPTLAFNGFDPDLYSKTSLEGFLVAMRFWIARLHNNMQLGSGESRTSEGCNLVVLGSDLTSWPKVTNVDQISPDLWRVVTCTQVSVPDGDLNAGAHSISGSLILGQTGELITTSPQLVDLPFTPERLEKANVRQDWQAFIERQSSSTSEPRLGDRIRTKNPCDFPAGVSKRWAKTALELADGVEILAVARRAVYTACASNSFSGAQMAAWQMEAELAGRGTASPDMAPNRLPELYLPEAEQVDSVHFPPVPTHEALAYVHRTSGHTDIVLRETGQVVGEEDGGVVPLWQGLLGCDERGKKDSTICENFFAGWAERLLEDNN